MKKTDENKGNLKPKEDTDILDWLLAIDFDLGQTNRRLR
jgi:hypothetical protein